MIQLREHEKLILDGFPVEYDERYNNLDLIKWDNPMDSKSYGYYASFKIGAEWIDNKESLIVTPKRGMENIDFLSMFMACFTSDLALDSFNEIYKIDLDKPQIESPSLNSVISPLIVIHFVSVVNRIKSLKRGYVHRHENLKKVKGHIKLLKNERLNIATKRYDRIYCDYVDMKSVRQIRSSKLFNEYSEAVRLAKTILKRFDYSINKASVSNNKITPFVLDMSLLYEHYVYGLLHEAYHDKITYQFKGKTGYPDFLYKSKDFKAILDTKYIPKYEKGFLDAYVIRQLSGYSRDLPILKYLGYDNLEEDSPVPSVPCVIIYPEEGNDVYNPFINRNLNKLCTKPLRNLSMFYLINIPVPVLLKNKESS